MEERNGNTNPGSVRQKDQINLSFRASHLGLCAFEKTNKPMASRKHWFELIFRTWVVTRKAKLMSSTKERKIIFWIYYGKP